MLNFCIKSLESNMNYQIKLMSSTHGILSFLYSPVQAESCPLSLPQLLHCQFCGDDVGPPKSEGKWRCSDIFASVLQDLVMS